MVCVIINLGGNGFCPRSVTSVVLSFFFLSLFPVLFLLLVDVSSGKGGHDGQVCVETVGGSFPVQQGAQRMVGNIVV